MCCACPLDPQSWKDQDGRFYHLAGYADARAQSPIPPIEGYTVSADFDGGSARAPTLTYAIEPAA